MTKINSEIIKGALYGGSKIILTVADDDNDKTIYMLDGRIIDGRSVIHACRAMNDGYLSISFLKATGHRDSEIYYSHEHKSLMRGNVI